MTPGYSPPEQYGTARTDPRTDIYSLGATLYATLCGIIPEDGLARAMDNAQLTPLRKRNPKISRRLAAAIEKAMAIDPADRFQTAEDFKKALLSSKSKTEQLTGNYTVVPPPDIPESPAESAVNEPESPRPKQLAGPIPPSDERRKAFRSAQKKATCFSRFLVVGAFGSFDWCFVWRGLFRSGFLPANMRDVPAVCSVHTSPTSTPTETATSTALPMLTFTPVTSVTPTITLSTHSYACQLWSRPEH